MWLARCSVQLREQWGPGLSCPVPGGGGRVRPEAGLSQLEATYSFPASKSDQHLYHQHQLPTLPSPPWGKEGRAAHSLPPSIPSFFVFLSVNMNARCACSWTRHYTNSTEHNTHSHSSGQRASYKPEIASWQLSDLSWPADEFCLAHTMSFLNWVISLHFKTRTFPTKSHNSGLYEKWENLVALSPLLPEKNNWQIQVGTALVGHIEFFPALMQSPSLSTLCNCYVKQS